MNPTLQRWLDEMLATGAQQWLLRLLAVGAALGALLAVGAASGRWWPFWAVVVAGLAVASAVRPDAHTALLVPVIVVWSWLATVDDLDTPWLPFAALSLLVFHAVIALLAGLPIGGRLPAPILLRTLGRVGLVAAATVAMWVLVVVLDRRDAAGNGALTGLGLVIVAGAAALIRWHSLERPADR